ncbi:HEAT repeat domain-containing protein [Singulisphaera acidiphila]|uniref:HEAT repeat domain-containing protein n=1 Tax=Singulisphaera acidiphila TaxID=466153 RepID=UPI00030789B0|nr:HEAT repeat domain-containing protein [Singulisphaera acidiphila]
MSSLADSQDAVGPLRRALASRSSSMISRAASLAARFHVREVEPDLQTAFDHFLGKGAGSDNLCSAKIAVVKALRALNSEGKDLYVRGMQHYWPARPRQGQRDQAATLRIVCADALTEVGHLELLTYLIDLLADPTPGVRVAAALALGSTGEREATLLLRLKALSVDESPEVLEACFTALLSLEAAAAVPFIGRFLVAEDEKVKMTAALALGQSEHQDALDLLTACWNRQTTQDSRSDLLVAIALLRYPRAIEFLVSLVDGGEDDAENALRALATFRADPQVLRRVELAIDRTNDPLLRRSFEAKFRRTPLA